MTSTSRRKHLASRPDRPDAPPASLSLFSALQALLAAGLLLVVSILSALAAAQFLAAAAGRRVSPWDHLPLPATADGWILPLAVAAGVLLLLMVVELQRSEQIVAVSVSDNGAVLVPADTLERLVERVALEHREVVRARAQVQSREGRLVPRLWVALRPLADARTITEEVAGEVAATLASRTGLPLDEPRVRAKTLAVRQLRRYLS